MEHFLFILEDVFLKIFNMSLTAVWIILAVMVLRLIFKKAPKTLACALWLLAAVRLVLPFSVESALSLVPSGEVIHKSFYADSGAPVTTVHTGVSFLNSFIGSAEPIVTEAKPTVDVMIILSVVWAVGVFAVLLYALISFLILGKKVAASVKYKDNIYFCDGIESPFILGVFRPKIYLPSAIGENEFESVLAHEKAHLKRKDNIIKPLAFLILAVHWFNPLCVLAYILLCRDIELACDEKVIKTLPFEERKEYSQTLLNLSVKRKTIAACPLAFGEVGVKARIKNVLNYKKPAFWVIVVALVACVAVTAFFVTNPKEKEPFENDIIKVAETESEEPSVSMKVVSAEVKPGGLVITVRWENNSDEAISYGEPFWVSRFETLDGTYTSWIDSKDSRASNAIAYIVSPKGKSEHSYYISSSTTEPGRYKLETNFNFDSENSKIYKISVTFDLKKEIEITDGSATVVGGAGENTLSGGSKLLSFFDLEKLSDKGEKLSAKDFKDFAYYETGSGLCIRVYPINDNLEAWLGFTDDPEKSEPIYFTLMISQSENIDMTNSAEMKSYLRTHTDELFENVISEKIIERAKNESGGKGVSYVTEAYKILKSTEDSGKAIVYFAETDIGFSNPHFGDENPSVVFENDRFGIATFKVENKKYTLSKIRFLTKSEAEEEFPQELSKKVQNFDFSKFHESCEERAKNYFGKTVCVYRYEDGENYSELRLFTGSKNFDISIPVYMSSHISGTYEEKNGELVLHTTSIVGKDYVFKRGESSYIYDKEKSPPISMVSMEKVAPYVPDKAEFKFVNAE
ncbi:MAG: M56 family metallopeptidase [Clostridia bacterium]|nr:M56 family metallopeptidase [Clostridia bacterium]